MQFQGFKRAVRRLPLVRRLAQRWRNPDYAAIERARMRAPGLAVLQPWTTTAEDRYPAVFDALAARLAHLPEPRVLSFGCSGGEEVRALRARLPLARITGIDVNPRAVSRARRRDRDPLSRYLHADRPPAGETFNAVLALAVFRHGTLEAESMDSCADLLPFARVAEAVRRIDAALAPGGLLAWGNAHFRLTDVPGLAYDRLPDDTGLPPAEVLYGSDDRRIDGIEDSGGIYRKRG